MIFLHTSSNTVASADFARHQSAAQLPTAKTLNGGHITGHQYICIDATTLLLLVDWNVGPRPGCCFDLLCVPFLDIEVKSGPQSDWGPPQFSAVRRDGTLIALSHYTKYLHDVR
ncbi:hypothetical protein VTK56DRAFT_7437 [Thermocarpiscus australiensis]